MTSTRRELKRHASLTEHSEGAEIVLQQELREMSGPIPSAEELEGYENVLPGSAERFFTMRERQIALVEAQVHHRIEIEKTVIKGDTQRSHWGLALGFVFAMSVLGVAGFLGFKGQATSAIAIAIADMGTLASVFVYGSNSRRAEREGRAKAMTKELDRQEPEGDE